VHLRRVQQRSASAHRRCHSSGEWQWPLTHCSRPTTLLRRGERASGCCAGAPALPWRHSSGRALVERTSCRGRPALRADRTRRTTPAADKLRPPAGEDEMSRIVGESQSRSSLSVRSSADTGNDGQHAGRQTHPHPEHVDARVGRALDELLMGCGAVPTFEFLHWSVSWSFHNTQAHQTV
jgi:hypothetical protein